MSSDTVLGTVVICAALDVEYRAVRDHLDGPLADREHNGSCYQVGTFRTDRGRWQVALRQTSDGNAQAATELERAVSVFHPQIVLFVGVAGGRKDVRLGDVVVADHVYDYESGKDTADGFLPRIKTRAPAYRLIECARPLARDDTWQHRILPATPETAPKAVIKPIAAGSKVVADQDAATAQYLAQHCGDAVAVEMEGAGFLHGAYVNESVQALVVRGISDLLSGKTEIADEHWQPVASAHAAAFAFELLARYTPPPAAAAVPRQLLAAPQGFTGRTTELNILTDTLDKAAGEGGTVAISALGGAGGIGKTWLALHWAHTHLNRFPDGQLFVDLHGFSIGSQPMEPLAAVRGFLDTLGVPPERISGNLDKDATLYRSLVAGKRMLIILDNAVTSDQVVHLLPGSPTCTVLITGRKPLKALITRHGAHHLHLDVLPEAEAHALLVQRLGHARVAAEPEAARELIRLCGRYPLALAIMTGRAHRHHSIPLTEFVTELRRSRLDTLDDKDEPTASLPAVLSLSLRDLSAEQRAMFALLGPAPGPNISIPAAASLANFSLNEARAELEALEEASLLERHAGSRYAMHDLIRDYATTTASQQLTEEKQKAALQRVTEFYTRTADAAASLVDSRRQFIQITPLVAGIHPLPLPDATAAMNWLDIEHPNLLAVQRTASSCGWHPAVFQMARALFTFQYRRGYHRERIIAWRAALDAAGHLPDPTRRALAHRNLGYAYASVERIVEGIGHLRQALALTEKRALVSEDYAVEQARIHLAIAWAWSKQGDMQSALEYASFALDLHRNLDAPRRKADALHAVGYYAARLGRYETARDHCRKALALHCEHKNRDGEAGSLHALAYIDYHSGQYKQAISQYLQSLDLRRAHNNAFECAKLLDELGHPHAALGERDKARAAWQEALKLYRQQGRDTDAGRVQRQLDELDVLGGGVALTNDQL